MIKTTEEETVSSVAETVLKQETVHEVPSTARAAQGVAEFRIGKLC